MGVITIMKKKQVKGEEKETAKGLHCRWAEGEAGGDMTGAGASVSSGACDPLRENAPDHRTQCRGLRLVLRRFQE